MESGGDVIDYAQYFIGATMNIFFLLKTQWEFFGLRAPAFSWVASAGIIAYFIMVYLRQWRESRIRQRAFSIADKRLKSLQTGKPGDQSKGIARQLYDEIDKTFNNVPLLQATMADPFLLYGEEDRQER